MDSQSEQRLESAPAGGEAGAGSLRVVLILAALAAVGAGFAIAQILERRLTRPEIARLKFYRYLREKGHLES
jgi:hypothetical protein